MITTYGIWDHGEVSQEVLLSRILETLHICKRMITKTAYVFNPAIVDGEYERVGFSSLKIYYKGRATK